MLSRDSWRMKGVGGEREKKTCKLQKPFTCSYIWNRSSDDDTHFNLLTQITMSLDAEAKALEYSTLSLCRSRNYLFRHTEKATMLMELRFHPCFTWKMYKKSVKSMINSHKFDDVTHFVGELTFQIHSDFWRHVDNWNIWLWNVGSIIWIFVFLHYLKS